MRSDWNRYFIEIAVQVATRATCDRKHVGCVVVKGNNILATGYNGSIVGQPHCDDVGHMMEDGHCVATVHAEVNAIAQAAKLGHAVEGAEVFVTAFPCWNCFKLLANSGITRITYASAYRVDPKVIKAAYDRGIKLVELSTT